MIGAITLRSGVILFPVHKTSVVGRGRGGGSDHHRPQAPAGTSVTENIPSDRPRRSHDQMVEGLERMIIAKSDWLATFSSGSKKRPDHEIEVQTRHLEVLEQAAADYRRAAERKPA